MRNIQWNLWGKGLIVGATMTVPGVSGGTMAMILGIYDRLITAAGSFLKEPRRHSLFLLTFSIGALLGFFLFSTPVSWLLENYRIPTLYFFIGAVLGGIPVIGKKSGIQKVGIEVIAYLILGAVIVLAISNISGKYFSFREAGFWGDFTRLLLAGGISAVALILPGISFSHFLLILGLYEPMLEAVKTLELTFLIPLAVGVFAGILLFTKLLETLMQRFAKQTYLIILGFIVGSAAQIFPGVSFGIEQFFAVFAMGAGFFLTYTKN